MYCVAPDQFQRMFPPLTYSGPLAGHKFIKALLDTREKIRKLYKESMNLSMKPLTMLQKQEHEQATNCYLCGEQFSECDLSMSEYIDTLGSKVFTYNENDEEKQYCLSSDYKGPKVRKGSKI